MKEVPRDLEVLVKGFLDRVVNSRECLARFPLWLVPLTLALLLFLPVTDVPLTSDGTKYATAGMNLAYGRGLVGHDLVSPELHRPLVPFLMAVSFRIFGVSLMSSWMTVRVFFALNAIMMYRLGSSLYSRWTGLLASLLVLTSYSLNTWSALVHLDHVLAFFLMFFVHGCHQAFENEEHWLFALSGLVLGLGFLVKELAILYLPLPFFLVLIVRRYRRRHLVLRSLLVVSGFALVVVPWLVYVYSLTHEPRLVLGQAAYDTTKIFMETGTGGSKGFGSFFSYIGYYLRAIPSYYRLHLQPNFALAPGFVVAIVATGLAAAKGDRSSLVLLLAIGASGPMVLFQGALGFRSRQMMVLFLLLYLALARALLAPLGLLTSGAAVRLPNRIVMAGTLVLCSAVLVAQCTYDRSGTMREFVADFNSVRGLFDGGRITTEGHQAKMEAAEWIMANIEPGARFMGFSWSNRFLSFVTKGHYVFHDLPLIDSQQVEQARSEVQRRQHAIVLFLDQFGNQEVITQDLTNVQLLALTEQELLRGVLRKNIDYVWVGGRLKWLSVYCLTQPGFVKVAEFGPGDLLLFRVFPERLIDIYPSVVVHPDVSAFLREAQDSAELEQLVERFFVGMLGWTFNDVIGISSGEVPTKHLDQPVDYDIYVQWVEDQELLDRSIAVQRTKVTSMPSNPWPLITLARLFQATAEGKAAVECYRQAIMRSSNLADILEYIAVDVDDRYLPLYLVQGEKYQTPGETVNGVLGHSLILEDFADSVGVRSTSPSSLVRRSVFVIDGYPMGVLFQHPASQVGCSLSVPSDADLYFSLALSPDAWQLGKGDGVQFEVFIDDGLSTWHPFSEYIDPKNVPAHRRWHDREIDLSPWAGKTITLTFATGCGPNNDCRYDWAGWGEPRIVQPIAYNFLDELPNARRSTADQEQMRQDTFTIDYEPRPVLFEHTSNRVTYHVDVPQRAGLHFGLGMDPSVWSPDKGDGVEYNVYVRRPDDPYVLHRVFHRYVDPKNNPDDRHWHDEVVDLSEYGGETVDIIFETLPGRENDSRYDWAGWSRPVLVGDDMALLNQDVQVPVPTPSENP